MSFSKEQIEAILEGVHTNYVPTLSEVESLCKQLLEVMAELEELRHT